jgi:O-antigen ligase
MAAPTSGTKKNLAESVLDRAWSLGKRWWIAGVVLLGGAIIGSQIASPNRRMIQVIAAGVLVLGALRVNSLMGLLILIPLLPFPKVTAYGSTNVAFVLFIFIIWMARVVLRTERAEGRSAIDLPVVLLIMAYLLSFSQIDDHAIIRSALTNFFLALTFIAICYLAVHLIHDERQLRKVVWSIIIMGGLVQFTALFELAFPDRALVAGWIDLTVGLRHEYIREGLEIRNMRVGGAFRDYELLAEFCAMLILLQWFVLMQTRGLWARTGVVVLIGVSTFVLIATVTRGAIMSLAIAGAYLIWMTRRRIKFHTFVLAALGAIIAAWVLFGVVTTQTRSGNILDRLMGTEFKGLVPDSRTVVWADAWKRGWESPILGHGPYFTHRVGVKHFYWPHNNYLFYWHIVGFFGLAAFLFVIFRLWRASRFHAPNLGNKSYAGGLLLALQAMLLLFVVDQIKIDYIRSTIYPYWVWLFFGLIVATSRIARQEIQEQEQPVRQLVEESREPARLRSVSDEPSVQSPIDD